jgi:hypothetical protein
MPRFTQAGQPIPDVQSQLEQIIRKACGGSLCVKLQIEASDETTDSCTYVRAEPNLDVEGGTVIHQRTIVLVTGTRPCQSESSPGDSAQPGDTATPLEGRQQGTPGDGQPSAGTP